MSDLSKHTQSGVTVNSTLESGIVRDSVKASSNLRKIIQFASGAILPSFGGSFGAAPVIEFATHNIKLLTAPAVYTSGALKLCFRAYSDAGGLGSGYISYVADKALFVPVTLAAQRGAEAVLTIQAYLLSSDGDTAPLTVGTTSDDLSVTQNIYTLGEVSLGSALSGVNSVNFDFGYQVVTNESQDGLNYPTHALVPRRQASMTVELEELAAASAARLLTGESATSGIYAEFRKLQEGGVVTDTGKATVTMAKALAEISNVAGGSPSSVSLMLTPVDDGAGNDYVTFS